MPKPVVTVADRLQELTDQRTREFFDKLSKMNEQAQAERALGEYLGGLRDTAQQEFEGVPQTQIDDLVARTEQSIRQEIPELLSARGPRKASRNI